MNRLFSYWEKSDPQEQPVQLDIELTKGDVLAGYLLGFYRGVMSYGTSVEPIDLPDQLCRLGQMGVVVDREDVMNTLVQIYNECRGQYGFQDKKALGVPLAIPTDDDLIVTAREIRHMMDTGL